MIRLGENWIYRNVWLVKTAQVHDAQWGAFVTTPTVSATSATVQIETTIENNSATNANVTTQTSVYEIGANDQKIGKAVVVSPKIPLEVFAAQKVKREIYFEIINPKLWRTTAPNRYVAVTNIARAGKIIDVDETVFGIRTIEFDADKGLLLNGELVYLKGVCQHHDLGALGTAVNRRALERQFEILAEMGVNAIRTSHNPPAPELLDLADKKGFLIIDEAFDAWAGAKKKNDYASVFQDWQKRICAL